MNTLKTSHTFIRILPGTLWGMAILFLLAGTLHGASDDFFVHQQIDVSGTILGTLEADFSGDGNIDIVLLAADQSGRRTLESYIQRESGRFPPSPGQTLDMPSSISKMQSLDIDNDGRMELYFLDGNGLWQYTHNGDEFSERPKALISIPTMFGGGIEGRLLSQDCIYFISGRPVAFIPVTNGYSLWEYTEGKFKARGLLSFSHLLSAIDRPVKLFSGHSLEQQEWYRINIPAIVIADSNGDDLDDIYLMWFDRLALFAADEQGQFSSENSLRFRFQDPAAGNLCQSRLVDFDRDGRLDVVCSRSAGGISGARTDINFFHSTQIRRRDRTGNYAVSLTDACGNLLIDDFDGSGRPELVVPAVELGIMSTVKKMITKKTDLHILIYPIDNLGRPAQEPMVRKKISCRLDFESADPTADIRINWTGDYDGDGRNDLVVADGGGQLVFYRGAAENYLESKADLVLDISDPDEIRPVHLNSDGQTDLVIIHKQVEGTTRLTLLVTNRIG